MEHIPYDIIADVLSGGDPVKENLFKDLIRHHFSKKPQGQAHRGSVQGRRYINRDHAAGHQAIMRDYFGDNPVYSDELFRRRFRMDRELFEKILGDLSTAYVEYFIIYSMMH